MKLALPIQPPLVDNWGVKSVYPESYMEAKGDKLQVSKVLNTAGNSAANMPSISQKFSVKKLAQNVLKFFVGVTQPKSTVRSPVASVIKPSVTPSASLNVPLNTIKDAVNSSFLRLQSSDSRLKPAAKDIKNALRDFEINLSAPQLFTGAQTVLEKVNAYMQIAADTATSTELRKATADMALDYADLLERTEDESAAINWVRNAIRQGFPSDALIAREKSYGSNSVPKWQPSNTGYL
jgi:hypothetical protein